MHIRYNKLSSIINITLSLIIVLVLCGCMKKTSSVITTKAFFQDDYILYDDNGTIKCENYDYVICIEKEKNKDFKILNFADVQLTKEEVQNNSGVATCAYDLMRELIEETNPDLITLSGDQGYGEAESINAIASLIDSYGIKWAYVFGNHDNECSELSIREQVALYSSYSNCISKYGPTNLDRGGNNIINIVERDEDGFHIVRSIFMLNSGNVTEPYEIDGEKINNSFYENLNEKQIGFYKWGLECSKKYNNGEYAKSTIIEHIPITAYAFAFADAFITEHSPYEFSKIVGIAVGYLPRDTYDGSCWKEGYKDSFGVCHEMVMSSPVDDHIFDILLEYGSTDSMLVGHDHKNNYSINYKGIRLTYGLKTGYGCYYDMFVLGATTLTFNGSNVTVTHIYK